MTGRSYIVTGGTSGIGFEIARHLAEAGDDVTLMGRDTASADAAVARIKAQHPNALLTGVGCDLTDFEAIKEFAATWGQEPAKEGEEQPAFVVKPLKGLVHCAAVQYGQKHKKKRVDKNGFEVTAATNIFAPIVLTNAFMKQLEAGGDMKTGDDIVDHPGRVLVVGDCCGEIQTRHDKAVKQKRLKAEQEAKRAEERKAKEEAIAAKKAAEEQLKREREAAKAAEAEKKVEEDKEKKAEGDVEEKGGEEAKPEAEETKQEEEVKPATTTEEPVEEAKEEPTPTNEEPAAQPVVKACAPRVCACSQCDQPLICRFDDLFFDNLEFYNQSEETEAEIAAKPECIRPFNGVIAYRQSKIALHLFFEQWANALFTQQQQQEGAHFRMVTICPGIVPRTNLQRHAHTLSKFINRYMHFTPTIGQSFKSSFNSMKTSLSFAGFPKFRRNSGAPTGVPAAQTSEKIAEETEPASANTTVDQSVATVTPEQVQPVVVPDQAPTTSQAAAQNTTRSCAVVKSAKNAAMDVIRVLKSVDIDDDYKDTCAFLDCGLNDVALTCEEFDNRARLFDNVRRLLACPGVEPLNYVVPSCDRPKPVVVAEAVVPEPEKVEDEKPAETTPAEGEQKVEGENNETPKKRHKISIKQKLSFLRKKKTPAPPKEESAEGSSESKTTEPTEEKAAEEKKEETAADGDAKPEPAPVAAEKKVEEKKETPSKKSKKKNKGKNKNQNNTPKVEEAVADNNGGKPITNGDGDHVNGDHKVEEVAKTNGDAEEDVHKGEKEPEEKELAKQKVTPTLNGNAADSLPQATA